MVGRRWLFVGGIARSGTTLMARLLTLHPEAFVTAECGWPLDLYWGMMLPPGRGYSHATWRHSSGLEQTVPWVLPRLGHYDDAAAVTRAMCEGYMAGLHPEARVCGDKWPMLGALHPDGGGRRVWEDLRVLWPDCKLLFMERDLEAALASARRVWPRGGSPAGFRRQALERLEGQRLCADAYRVRLEALNESPRAIMEGVLGFAGLETDAYPWDAFDAHFKPGHRVN